MNLSQAAEGLIFAAGEQGIAFHDLYTSLQVSPDALQEILEELQQFYASRGFHLVQHGSLVRFVCDEQLYPYAADLFERTQRKNLSSAALETLSIIAYQQPITTAAIEKIRGVSCESILNRLLELELVERVHLPDSRINHYITTNRFLEVFGLHSLAELPSRQAPDTLEPKE